MIEMEFDKCSFSFYLLTVFLTFYSNDQNLGWLIPDTLQAHRELQKNYWTFNLVLNTYMKTRICPYSNFFFASISSMKILFWAIKLEGFHKTATQ